MSFSRGIVPVTLVGVDGLATGSGRPAGMDVTAEASRWGVVVKSEQAALERMGMSMTEESYQHVTLGEIGRSMARMELSMAEMRADLRDRATRFEGGIATNTGAIASLKAIVDEHSDKLREQKKCWEETDKRVDGIQNKSFFLSGGIAAAGVFINFLLRNHS